MQRPTRACYCETSNPHDDELLWDIVAFLRKMPELTADEYQALVRSAPKTHEEMMQDMDMHGNHDHGGHDRQ